MSDRSIYKRCTPLIVSVMLLCLICSGAKVIEQTPNNFIPTQNQSIIFGKSEVIYNAKPLPYDGYSSLMKKSIFHHIGKYTNKNELKRNPYAPGDYAFGVTYDDEYFAYSLPPGTYYFSEFGCLGIILDSVKNVRGVRVMLKNMEQKTNSPA